MSNSFQINGSMMEISGFTGGMASTNGWLVRGPAGVWVVDAPQGMASWLREEGVKVNALLLTHQHFDHVEDAAEICADHGARLYSWNAYDRGLTLERFLESVGMPMRVSPYKVDEVLEGKEKLEVCGTALQLKHIPGHSLDSIVFIAHAEKTVFGGDVLFAGSVGRSDFPGGSMELLVSGIQEKLLTLPDDFVLLPGHGPQTTIGNERHSNPFLQE